MLKFWSNIGLFLQIAIVVAAVILFNLFDPFGWLGSKKQTLEDTPISVKSIREIGKFISSEYYGEVLTSLQEAFIEELKEVNATEADVVTTVAEEFEEAIRDLHERKSSIRLRGFNKRKKLYELIYKEYPITSHPYYQTYIQLVMAKHKEKNEKKFLMSLYDDLSLIDNDTSYLTIAPAVFGAQLKKDMEVLTGDKKFRKSQIVVLGRGWVKAGIDFGTFNDNNFKYDKINKTIHLVGMKPEILFSTINPWFIPEKQVKGFEVIVITNRAKKPEYMQKVKSRSLKKLRQQAIQSGILEQAKKNAEDNLRSFFSLLIPEGIDEVIIHDSFFSYFDTSFVTDSLTSEVMQSIDSLFVSRYLSDSAAVISLRDSIADKRVSLNGKLFPVNRYSSRMQMAEDGVLSSAEMKWLKAEKQSLEAKLDSIKEHKISTYSPDRLDSIWFLPKQSIVDEYRQEVNKQFTTKFSWSKVISDHPDYLEDQRKRKEAVKVMVHELMLQRKLSALENLQMAFQENVDQVVIDNTTYVRKKEAEPDTVIQEQTIKANANLDSLFVSIEGGIHSWQAPMEQDTIELDTYKKLTKDMEASWGIDDKCIFNMRDKILKNWSIQIDSGYYPVSRFVALEKIKTDRAISAEEIREIIKIDQSLKKAQDYLTYVDLKKQELAVLKSQNDTLSQILYYPNEETIKSFTEAAENKRYWASGNKKKRLKERYMEFQIQRHVWNQRKKDFDERIKSILSGIDAIPENSEFDFERFSETQ